MKRLIAFISVVCIGVVFLQTTSYSHEGHGRRRPKAEEINAVKDEPVLNPDEAPEIVFESYNHDFGTIYAGDKVTHLFKFKNSGKGDLVIKKVKTSCGCTAAATSKGNIPPGESGEIKTTFRASKNPGSASKSITVITNDPAKPRLRLVIAATIVKEIVTKPQWLNFGSLIKGEVGIRTVEMSSGVDEFNLEVTGVESDSPFVTASYEKQENGKGYIVTVTTKDDVPIGRMKGKVIVTTNSTRRQKLAISFNGKVTGDVIVSRPVLSYGKVVQGRVTVRKLIITLRKKDIDVKDVEVTPAFLSANIRDKANPDLPYREVEIKLGDDAPVGKINGRITIHTSSKLQPIIEIPVFGEVQERKTKKG